MQNSAYSAGAVVPAKSSGKSSVRGMVYSMKLAGNLFTAQVHLLYILHHPANNIEVRHGLASSDF